MSHELSKRRDGHFGIMFLDIFDLPACDQMGVSYPIINVHIWKQTGCSYTMDYASLFRDYASTYIYIYIYILYIHIHIYIYMNHI